MDKTLRNGALWHSLFGLLHKVVIAGKSAAILRSYTILKAIGLNLKIKIFKEIIAFYSQLLGEPDKSVIGCTVEELREFMQSTFSEESQRLMEALPQKKK